MRRRRILEFCKVVGSSSLSSCGPPFLLILEMCTRTSNDLVLLLAAQKATEMSKHWKLDIVTSVVSFLANFTIVLSYSPSCLCLLISKSSLFSRCAA